MKKKRVFIITFLTLVFLLTSCGVKEQALSESSPMNAVSSSTASEMQSSSESNSSSVSDGIIRISTYNDLKNITKNPSGHYMLNNDIDCSNSVLEIGNFSGILDGNGHTIYSVKNSHNWTGIFGIIESSAIVKNIGFYNIQTTKDNRYHFALAGEVHGTIENVSFHLGGQYLIGSVFNIIKKGCQISNFVVYANNTDLGGFFNSGHVSYIQNPSNIYIFADYATPNAQEAATAFFETGMTGKDYVRSDVYKGLDFMKIFDCSSSGMWAMDFNLRIPLIKHASVSVT